YRDVATPYGFATLRRRPRRRCRPDDDHRHPLRCPEGLQRLCPGRHVRSPPTLPAPRPGPRQPRARDNGGPSPVGQPLFFQSSSTPSECPTTQGGFAAHPPPLRFGGLLLPPGPP